MLTMTPMFMLCIALNLVVLYFLLRHFLFGRVTKVIEARQQIIENNMSEAEEKRSEAQDVLTEYNAKMTGAGKEAADILEKARTKAERDYRSHMEAAHNDARDLAQRTQAQLEQERVEMLSGVRSEVAALALLAAARVSGHEMDGDDEAALVQSFLQEAGEWR